MKIVRIWTVAALCSMGNLLYAQTSSYSTQQIAKDLEYLQTGQRLRFPKVSKVNN